MERAEPPSPAARLEPWAAVLALAWCALRLGRGLGPAPFYSSDCAVPILLMQGMGQGPFTLFYPRQDRFGMWPFLLGRLLHLQTPEAYHVLSVLGLCSAALPLSALLGSTAVAVVTLMVPFAVSWTVAWSFLQAGQPYLWQVVALCWAWWACRGALTAQARASRALALAGFAVLGSFAAWMNTASLAMLLAVAIVEILRARARPVSALGVLAGVLAAAAFEASLHHWYNAYCVRTFGQAFLTPLRLDQDHLLGNVGSVVGALARSGGIWPLLAGLGCVALLRRARAERFDQVGLLALAGAVLPGLIGIRYFRENQFAARYLSLPIFFALAAAAHGGLRVLAASAGTRGPWVRVVALGALLVAVPAGPADFLGAERQEARALAARGPTVLLADYWDVYVPASLALPGVLLPIGAESSTHRYPGTERELLPGRSVLLPCALDRPDGTVEQYGALLRRTDAAPIPGARLSWCPHRVERAAAAARSL